VNSVLITGASGYAGALAAELIRKHPSLELARITARSDAGKRLNELHPQYGVDLVLDEPAAEDGADVDAAIVAYPHGAAAPVVAALREQGVRVVDLSADFRLHDLDTYSHWYGEHGAPQLLGDAVYGLTELHREAIAGADLVANPGCYPTATLLALAPALKAGLIEDDVIVDAKSGVSGAGHTVDEAFLYGTIDESVRPYGVPGHRHTPEIAQEIAGLSGRAPRLTFTPHLVPMTRGLIASCYATLRSGVTAAKVADAYASAYAEEPFIRLVSSYPSTKATLGSNWCLVHPVVDAENGRLVVFGAIDNLVKGAAGSAVQNLNAIRGLPETMGLESLPLWP
jgi:N-acetyl-gamma-glutamyl-phosphate reductase